MTIHMGFFGKSPILDGEFPELIAVAKHAARDATRQPIEQYCSDENIAILIIAHGGGMKKFQTLSYEKKLERAQSIGMEWWALYN